MKDSIKIKRFHGKEILPFIPDLAKLRIEIFHDYPYLYEGNLEYEMRYLSSYVNSPESAMVIVFDGEQVVGMSTAIPLKFEMMEIQKPFLENNLAVQDYFYFGESVLQPIYRGRGIYPHFFREREAAAREYGCQFTTFCGVKRATDDPRRPANFKPLDKIWQRFGYVQHPELCAHFSWKEIGEQEESAKPMVFWVKKL